MSGEFETSLTENNLAGNLVASCSKTSRTETGDQNEIKASLRKEVLADLSKILPENQKEIFKLIASLNKKRAVLLDKESFDLEVDDISVAQTSTPAKTVTTTNTKTTPVNSRNMVTGVLYDSTNQPAKRPKQQRLSSEQIRDRPSISTFPSTNLLPMPKALTASLFDGKSKKVELFEDLFQNNIKMYPHLTEKNKKFKK